MSSCWTLKELMLTVLCPHDVQRAITPSISLPSHGSLPLPNTELWKQRSMPSAAGARHPYGSSPDSIEPSVCNPHGSCTACPAPVADQLQSCLRSFET